MHVQADGFGLDSVRLIQRIQRDSSGLQILLFSATFNDRVRAFAEKVAGSDANQVMIRPSFSFFSENIPHWVGPEQLPWWNLAKGYQ